MDIEGGTAAGIFYLILMLVLVAFFNALHLELVSGGPLRALVDQVLAFVPKLVAGGILIFIVWIIATVLRTIVAKALQATTLDEKLSAGAGMRPIIDNLGNVVFFVDCSPLSSGYFRHVGNCWIVRTGSRHGQ